MNDSCSLKTNYVFIIITILLYLFTLCPHCYLIFRKITDLMITNIISLLKRKKEY